MWKTVFAGLFGLVLALGLAQGDALAAGNKHQLVLQINDNDPAKMNILLNNASNVTSYYLEKGEEVEIEIVAYGPGLVMLVEGKSPVKDRIKSISENFSNITFQACGNTHAKMSKKAGKEVKLVSQAKMVTSGVVHLVQRQEEGWSYVRP